MPTNPVKNCDFRNPTKPQKSFVLLSVPSVFSVVEFVQKSHKLPCTTNFFTRHLGFRVHESYIVVS